MNRFVQKMIDAANDYLAKEKAREATREDLEILNSKGELSPQEYMRRIDKNKQLGIDNNEEYKENLSGIVGEYTAQVNKWGELKGEDLIPDAVLFNGDIVYTEDEMHYFAERFKDNASMLRVVMEYAKKNNILLLQHPTAEAKVEAINDVCNTYFYYLTPVSYWSTLLQTEGAFEEAYRNNKASFILGDGSEI